MSADPILVTTAAMRELADSADSSGTTHHAFARQIGETLRSAADQIDALKKALEEACKALISGIDSAAALDILTERERQKSQEGWTVAHDDEHTDGSLALAAACYAHGKPHFRMPSNKPRDENFLNTHANIWPWHLLWWKPKDRRRDLVRAGALILAEIERLDRSAALDKPQL